MFDLTFIHLSPFYELTALLLIAAIVGFISLMLRQPMVVSFILVGILVGPSFLGIIESHEHIELLAELGIAVLLFLVGLKLDIQLIKTLGLVALATGLGQVLFTSIIGYFIALALGMNPLTALYVAVALTFSSTIIIVKLLSDKHEVDSLHGRIAIGFLIVQDLVVVLAMIVLSALGVGVESDAGSSMSTHMAMVFLYGTILLVLVGFFIRYLANPLVSRIAHSPELLIIFAISWAAFMATLGNYFGFSKELGGLLAGISLASTPFRDAIAARLSSLRDFLLLFFFVTLGSKLNLYQLESQMLPALIFSIFVLIGNPLIVLSIMGAMGYRKRTGFFAGLTVAQISEFSLVFVAMGLKLGHVSTDALGLVTLVGLITIALSVYMITYSQSLYTWVEPALGVFERKIPYREEGSDHSQLDKKKYDIIIFGLGRYGKAIATELSSHFSILAIDFNPDEVQKWKNLGFEALYGDACDPELVKTLPLDRVKLIICAIPQHSLGLTHQDPRKLLIETLKRTHFSGQIAITTHHTREVHAFKNLGVHLIFQPYQDAATRAVECIMKVI